MKGKQENCSKLKENTVINNRKGNPKEIDEKK